VASRRISQIVETKRQFGKIADADGNDPNKSLFRRLVRLYQTGEIENQDQRKSLCFEIETLSQGISGNFSNSQKLKPSSSLRKVSY